MKSLELGHSLQLDTTWFELLAEDRQRRIEAIRLPAEEIEAEDGYLEEWSGVAFSRAGDAGGARKGQ